jgi:3-oxoacyl-[acyl-carrier-protein] synthase II
MKFNRVVVTGIGAITPVGNNVATFWKNLTDGVSGADKITQFDTTQFRTKFACEVKNYQPENFFDKKELKKLDAFGQYAFIAADEAIQDAELLSYSRTE